MATYHPATSAVFSESAAARGFVTRSSEREWAALAQVCALHAAPPDTGTHAQLDAAHSALVAVVRLGVAPHPTGTRSCSGCKRPCSTPGSATNRPARGHPPPATPSRHLGAGARGTGRGVDRYLDQLRVTRRPGSVANEDEALREFASFLTGHHPDIDSAAQVGRSHVEDYKRCPFRTARPPRRSTASPHRAAPVERRPAVLPAIHRLFPATCRSRTTRCPGSPTTRTVRSCSSRLALTDTITAVATWDPPGRWRSEFDGVGERRFADRDSAPAATSRHCSVRCGA